MYKKWEKPALMALIGVLSVLVTVAYVPLKPLAAQNRATAAAKTSSKVNAHHNLMIEPNVEALLRDASIDTHVELLKQGWKIEYQPLPDGRILVIYTNEARIKRGE